GRVAALGRALDRGLAALGANPALRNPRRIGGIGAIDLTVRDAGYLSDVAPILRARALERGLLLRPLGNTIYLMPPYCTTDDEVAAAFDTIGALIEPLASGAG